MADERRSKRESTLLDMGFIFETQTRAGVNLQDIARSDTSLAFSGYGEFTPITVRSETVQYDAHMERDQH